MSESGGVGVSGVIECSREGLSTRESRGCREKGVRESHDWTGQVAST